MTSLRTVCQLTLKQRALIISYSTSLPQGNVRNKLLLQLIFILGNSASAHLCFVNPAFFPSSKNDTNSTDTGAKFVFGQNMSERVLVS